MLETERRPLRVARTDQQGDGPIHGGHAAKRLLDVSVASIALVLLAPLMLAIWVAIRITSPGPAIFKQERIGLHHRPFTMYKFRTMYVESTVDVHRDYVSRVANGKSTPVEGMYKLRSDPRITRLGRWLRRTSIDELPQLWNVLRGEMSLVGPRPMLAWEAELFSEAGHPRFHVLPGMTGLWQVSGRHRLPMTKALELDTEYVGRQSLAFDLLVLARTVPVVLRREGV